MYPDGGFARLRVYGSVLPPPRPQSLFSSSSAVLENLTSALLGAVSPSSSDQHYGHRSNILLPGRGHDMGDGWETKRSRTPGHVDWVIVKLGVPAKSVSKVVVDTKDFKGNFPREVRVEGFASPLASSSSSGGGDDGADDDDDGERRADTEIKHDDPNWQPLLKGTRKGQPHTEIVFEGNDDIVSVPVHSSLSPNPMTTSADKRDGKAGKEQEGEKIDSSEKEDSNNNNILVWTHVKLTMIPDGGVKRLGVWGVRA